MTPKFPSNLARGLAIGITAVASLWCSTAR